MRRIVLSVVAGWICAAGATVMCSGCYTVPLRRSAAEIEEAAVPYCRGFQDSAESLAIDWLIGSHPRAPLYQYARFGFLTEGIFRDEQDEELAVCEFIAHVYWTDDTVSIYRFVFLDGDIVAIEDETPRRYEEREPL